MSKLSDAVEDITGGDESYAGDGKGPWRPALVRLAIDVDRVLTGGSTTHGDDIPGLLPGFDSEADLVRWEQRLVTRSLGMTPQLFLHGIAAELATPGERTVVAALLSEDARASDLNPDAATELRRRVRSRVVMPAFDRAFQELKTQATEYTEAEGGDDLHNPQGQRYIAMRPSVSELDHWQAYALEDLLNGELDSQDDVLGWGTVLEQATHGEPIALPAHDDEAAIPKFVDEVATTEPLLNVVTGDNECARVQFAAKFLLPAFNRGVSTMNAGELASLSRDSSRPVHQG